MSRLDHAFGATPQGTERAYATLSSMAGALFLIEIAGGGEGLLAHDGDEGVQFRIVSSDPFEARLDVRISGAVNEAALLQAFRDVIARHEILRTTFHAAADMTVPLQVIAGIGAQSIKDMGRVMAALKEKHAGQLDLSKAGGMVKRLLG